MSDLVTRLRDVYEPNALIVRRRAADEIERLRGLESVRRCNDPCPADGELCDLWPGHEGPHVNATEGTEWTTNGGEERSAPLPVNDPCSGPRRQNTCVCGHADDWHSHDGKGDCEGSNIAAPGSFVPCECERFVSGADDA